MTQLGRARWYTDHSVFPNAYCSIDCVTTSLGQNATLDVLRQLVTLYEARTQPEKAVKLRSELAANSPATAEVQH